MQTHCNHAYLSCIEITKTGESEEKEKYERERKVFASQWKEGLLFTNSCFFCCNILIWKNKTARFPPSAFLSCMGLLLLVFLVEGIVVGMYNSLPHNPDF